MKMQRLSTFALLLAAVAVPTFASNARTYRAATTASKPAEHAMTATGELASVDATGKSFSVKGKSATWSFKLGDNATITMKGKPVQFSELKAGEKVEVFYSGAAGAMTANKVVVLG